jgi:hypothetical protein
MAKKFSHPDNHDLKILKSLWTPLSQIPLNEHSQPCKINHPYASHLGYAEPREIEVSILGKFVDNVP